MHDAFRHRNDRKPMHIYRYSDVDAPQGGTVWQGQMALGWIAFNKLGEVYW